MKSSLEDVLREFQINGNDAGQRVDKFLTKAVPLLPQSMLYKAIRTKRIKLNGKRCEISTRLCTGDQLTLYLNDSFFDSRDGAFSFLRSPAAIDIIYEDENILLVNKPAGLVVHEDEHQSSDTLINRIQHHLYNCGVYNPAEENSFAPALCNRIDRNTAGIVIAAKNAAALRILNEKIKARELQKLYLCIVHGTMPKESDTLKAFLRKDARTNTVAVYDHPIPDGRTILTHYRVVAQKDRLSLLEIDLLTGRTHQIRAHLAHIGHPLLGDAKYGRNRDNHKTGLKHQALCAYKLTFHFQSDAGVLNGLNGRSFEVLDVWFRDAFFAGTLY